MALSDPEALDPSVSGAKAANLARAAGAGFATIPGFVITTTAVAAGLDDPAVTGDLRDAYERLVDGSTVPLVVRSSSVIEDTGQSSMAGRFTSVLDVVGWDAFTVAARTVAASAAAVRDAAGQVGSMAVLVQPQIEARIGGVMFGVDPVTGSHDRVVVEVVPSGPDLLVGGTAMADHYVLTRRGRVESATSAGPTPLLEPARQRDLVRMSRRAERVFGAPQDIEWLLDVDGRLLLLQTRPVTAIAAPDDHRRSVLLGPGPLAETFPSPLRPLEEDLWIEPLRDGITRALRTTGAVSTRALAASPVVTTVGGWPAVDLELIGVVEARTSFRNRINPVSILRKLGTAWRIGRLRVALPTLIDDVVAAVDRDLASVPRLDELADGDLVDLLERGRRELATVHSHEVLAGMLLRDEPATPTGAAVALQALHDARRAGWEDDAIVAGSPVVLVLVPPGLDRSPLPDTVSSPVVDGDALDRLGRRETLRVRARWVQELLARCTDELGRRLVARGAVPGAQTVGHLRLSELTSIADGGPPPADLAERPAHWPGPPLPVSFRLSGAGGVRPASVSSHAQCAEWAAGMPAGGGRVVGVACHGLGQAERPDSAILITRHLEPQLAPALGDLAGLVSETGSALSHLAILAREAGVPTVVAVPDALHRFPAGTRLMIDGRTGEIDVLDSSEERSGEMRGAGS